MVAIKFLSRVHKIVRVRFEVAQCTLHHKPQFSWRVQLLRSTKVSLNHSRLTLAAVARIVGALPMPNTPPPDLPTQPGVAWGDMCTKMTSTVPGSQLSSVLAVMASRESNGGDNHHLDRQCKPDRGAKHCTNKLAERWRSAAPTNGSPRRSVSREVCVLMRHIKRGG